MWVSRQQCGANGTMKLSKYLRSVMIAIGTIPGIMQIAQASEAPRRIITETIQQTPTPIKYVSASQTHSGFPVPRYVSLKFNRVNGRQGPSLQHPALWQYQRQGMPLIVVAEMDIWRKVRDINGDESWVRTQALSGKRTGVTIQDTALLKKPRPDSVVSATAPKDALLNIVECKSDNWCHVKSGSGHKGWIKQQDLWGAAPL